MCVCVCVCVCACVRVWEIEGHSIKAADHVSLSSFRSSLLIQGGGVCTEIPCIVHTRILSSSLVIIIS